MNIVCEHLNFRAKKQNHKLFNALKEKMFLFPSFSNLLHVIYFVELIYFVDHHYEVGNEQLNAKIMCVFKKIAC